MIPNFLTAYLRAIRSPVALRRPRPLPRRRLGGHAARHPGGRRGPARRGRPLHPPALRACRRDPAHHLPSLRRQARARRARDRRLLRGVRPGAGAPPPAGRLGRGARLGLRPLRRVRPRAPGPLPPHVPAARRAAAHTCRPRVVRPAASHARGDRRRGPPARPGRGGDARLLVRRARRHLAARRRLLLRPGPRRRAPARRVDRSAHHGPGRAARAPPPRPEREPAMARRESEVNAFLQGNFAPWRMEGVAEDLEVTGRIPPELAGTYYRNGPNPAFEPPGRYHWFDGDGMIHAITLADGRAHYRNRYVASAGLQEERAAGRGLFSGLLDIDPGEAPRFKNTGNTNIVWHAGRLLALMEAAFPTRMTPRTLETLGEFDFDGRLAGAMTAHPKMDPETGEMLFFGYSPFPPHLQYHVADRDGRLVRSEVIDVAWPSMMHDFAITKDYVIFIPCPLVLRRENLP